MIMVELWKNVHDILPKCIIVGYCPSPWITDTQDTESLAEFQLL